MNDIRIARALPNADALVRAVAAEDASAVAQILTSLDTTALHTLAIVLASQILPETTSSDRMTKAVRMAATAFHTTPSEVLSTSRAKEVLDARAVAAYVGKLLGLSSPEVGRHLDRDHSTVLHHWGRVGETPRLRRLATHIAEQLGWTRESQMDLFPEEAIA